MHSSESILLDELQSLKEDELRPIVQELFLSMGWKAEDVDKKG